MPDITRYRRTKRWRQITAIVLLALVVVLFFLQMFYRPRPVIQPATSAEVQAIIEASISPTPNRHLSLPDSLPLGPTQLDSLGFDPETSNYVALVKGHLARYQADYAQLRRLARHKHIDVILQIHNGPPIVMTDQMRANVAHCQLVMLQLLCQLKPQIVAEEGEDCDTINAASMLQQYKDGCGISHQPLNQAEFHQFLVSARDDFVAIRYSEINPKVRIMGFEDQPLLFLHVDVLEADLFGLHQIPDNLQDALKVERSMLGLARLLKTMDREHLHHGAMVIGYAHQPELYQAAAALGLDARFYAAYPH